MMLLTDVYLLDDLEIIEEGTGAKTMKVRGIFQRADELNANKRVYPRVILEKQITKLQPLISERRLCGELDHPQNDTVKLANASHLVTKLEMRGNDVIGEAEILNTPAGMTARALIKGGVKIGISSRGMGSLSESEDGTKKVNEDFKLVTFDIVADPSTRGAYPSLSESKEYRDLYEKSTSEKVFINLLRDRIVEKISGNQDYRKPVEVSEQLGIAGYLIADKLLNPGATKKETALGKAYNKLTGVAGGAYAGADIVSTISDRLKALAKMASGKRKKTKK